MWPVAPNIIHILGVDGLVSEGGSVLAGSRNLGYWAWSLDGDSGEVAVDMFVMIGATLLHKTET